MKKRWIVAAMTPLLVLGLVKVARAQESPFLNPPAENPFASLMLRQPPLNLEQESQEPDYLNYLHFYGLDYPHVKHFGGYVPSGQEQIFVHVFQPPKHSRGTIVTMHGYFVHTGLLVHLIAGLLDAHYTVVAIDLPGHGLSSGDRASIQNFEEYSVALADVTRRIHQLPAPMYLIGHSTGGAGIWEYLLKDREQPYSKVVLAAPLVRSAYWDLSMVGFGIGQGWLKEVPRFVGTTSSDPTFTAMVRRDPLQYPATPVQWVRALIEWNNHVIEGYPPTHIPMLIVQGTDDTVVDYSYNIPFLQRKFPEAQVLYLQGAKHDLLWEAPEIRKQAFASMLAFLAESPHRAR